MLAHRCGQDWNISTSELIVMLCYTDIHNPADFDDRYRWPHSTTSKSKLSLFQCKCQCLLDVLAHNHVPIFMVPRGWSLLTLVIPDFLSSTTRRPRRGFEWHVFTTFWMGLHEIWVRHLWSPEDELWWLWWNPFPLAPSSGKHSNMCSTLWPNWPAYKPNDIEYW